MNKKKLDIRYYFLERLLSESKECANYQEIVIYVLENRKNSTKREVLATLKQLSHEKAISRIANSFTHENTDGYVYSNENTTKIFEEHRNMRRGYLGKIWQEMIKPKNVAAKLNNFIWFCVGTLVALGIDYLKDIY